MEPLRDLAWMRYLLTGPPAERAERPGFTVTFVAVPRTTARHLERYRYRAFVFEPDARAPVLAVNLESDILGEFLITVEDARTREVTDRYDREPPYDEFRTRVLEEAGRRMSDAPQTARSRSAGRRPGGPRRGPPRTTPHRKPHAP